MSAIVPSYSPARSSVDEINTKLCDLSKDLDKFAPEHRSQVIVDRLKQQKLRAMISLAKAQHYLAETDVMIADYNLQAVAEEFEHMKKERYNDNAGDMRPPQNSEMKEEILVSSTNCPTSSGDPKDFCYVPLLHELRRKLSTLAEAHRSKSKTDAPKNIQPMKEIGGSEPTSKETKASSKTYEPTTSKTYKESSSKTKEAGTSKTYETSSSKTKEATTSKTYKESSSKTKEAGTSKTYEASSSRTKEATTSKTYKESSSKTKEATTSKTYGSSSSSKTKEATTSKTNKATASTKEAASHADTDLPVAGHKSRKRKRSKSKSKESKRHKSSHKHTKSSHAPAESTHVPTAASLNVHTASLGPVASSHAPAASSNVNTVLLGSAASSLVAAAPSLKPTASSHVQALLSHIPNCDCLISNRTIKEKTLLNTSISPIKKIVEAKGVQTDKKAYKNDIVQTNEVKTLTKAVQTDNVIIFHVGSQTMREKSPDIADDETLLLDTLPAPHSHSTAICLAKALEQIKSQKTSVLERLCPLTEPRVSHALSQNDVLQKIELIMEDEAEAVVEKTVAVKMELPDGDIPNTSTEVLVNNLYKDIMKAKNDEETSKGMKPKGRVTKRALWKVLDKC